MSGNLPRQHHRTHRSGTGATARARRAAGEGEQQVGGLEMGTNSNTGGCLYRGKMILDFGVG
eukprot:6091461-Pyramimonas_sp.AAC.1